jgi:hypothetical protein
MKSRRTKADIERLRAEIREAIEHPPAAAELERKRLSCGHEEDVAPGLDPANAICSQCRQAAMRAEA